MDWTPPEEKPLIGVKKIPLIGISGLSSSGKDTVADYLVEEYGFIKIAFADEMKRIIARLYPKMTRDHLWGSSKHRSDPVFAYPTKCKTFDDCLECGKRLVYRDNIWKCNQHGKVQFYLTARFILLQLNCFRHCYEDTMVDLTIKGISRIRGGEEYSQFDGFISGEKIPYAQGIVVPDVRWVMGNEGGAIRKNGGVLMKLTRSAGIQTSLSNHESELVVRASKDDQFDIVADNQEWTREQLLAFVNGTVVPILHGWQ